MDALPLIVALEYARKAAIPSARPVVLASLGDLYSDLQLWAQAQESYQEASDWREWISAQLSRSRMVRLLVRQHHYRAAQQVEQLPETTTRRHLCVLLLRAGLHVGWATTIRLNNWSKQALVLLEQGDSLMDLARAYLLQAIAASALSVTSDARQLSIGWGKWRTWPRCLLVAETLHLRGMLRH
jgi:hypothetical protein